MTQKHLQAELIDAETLDTFKPQQINDIIDEILNRYTTQKNIINQHQNQGGNNSARQQQQNSFQPHFSSNESSFQVNNNSSSSGSVINISNITDSVNLSSNGTSDVDKLAQYLMVDFAHSNDRTLHQQQSFLQKQNNVTVPQEFKFHLDKRRTENRTKDYSLEVEQQRMAECTFRPNINPTSDSMISYKQKDFFNRMMEWKKQKVEEKQKLSSRLTNDKLEECTFQPNVNPSVTSDSRDSDMVYHKLYLNSYIRQSKMEQNRDKLTEEQLRKYTFKPNLVAKIDSPVQPKYMRPQKPTKAPFREEENFSFQPQVNKPNSKYYSTSSQAYLKTNAFERLSRPKSPTPQPKLFLVDEEEIERKEQKRPKSAGAGTTRSAMNLTKFLNRQSQTVKRKEDKVQFLKDTSQPQPKTFTNKKSEEMLRANYKAGSFQQRQEHHQARIQQQKHLIERSVAKEYTFKPAINNISKHKPSKTVEQLSAGDVETYQRKIEKLKQKLEEKEMKESTFNPKINKNYEVQSTLRILEDPDAYLERVKQHKELLELKQRKLQMAKEQAELQQCTFKPETHDAPEYVKRIAKSMALTRMNNSNVSPKRRKPDWK